jgi:Raf kinase inhibitor-like YbhB/YbcL family protein
MKLSSNDFKHKEMMDSKYTCDGADVSPHLKWEDIPDNVKSFAISCNDPDAPIGDWIHWYVCDIPANVGEIPQGGPIPGIEVQNDFRKTSYGGPCPPSGTHRYFFRVYALNVEKLEGINKKSFKNQVNQHTIASAEMIGLYKRR